MTKSNLRLIETDLFPFEFLSKIAERESWRKEIYRPIYHLHKWWAKRLGSVFRGALLASVQPETCDLEEAFYQRHSFDGVTIFDPFLGSGTTLGEAHKLGFSALGRDINPVAIEAVSVGLGVLDPNKLGIAFETLRRDVGNKILDLYVSSDANGRTCDVLYYFWVMQAVCTECKNNIDLFSSYIVARNAYPERRPEVQVFCPSCGEIFRSLNSEGTVSCPSCRHKFDPGVANAAGAKATCSHCKTTFRILEALDGKKPEFRMYAKLVLTQDGKKEYLPTSQRDRQHYEECCRRLRKEVEEGLIILPSLRLEHGYNTKQAMSYGFAFWKDFFNDRQLLALGHLMGAILRIPDEKTRNCFLVLFSGVLEFNNMFASYKGEGTGAVRHMFSHHILKPERTPIEANVWGTPKSSGSFSGLFRSRIFRAIAYQEEPIEVNGPSGEVVVCSEPFSGDVKTYLPISGEVQRRGIYVSCGDSADTKLPEKSVDLVVTDPPFFDNVHYSELADFFYAWQQLTRSDDHQHSTRTDAEVQDADPNRFARKLQGVFRECHRILKDDGLLVFTYHHSRDEGWRAVAGAVMGAGFVVRNSHPVKAEMSVAMPKTQTKEPIQLDIILVCRKAEGNPPALSLPEALQSARAKLERLRRAGFELSQNDRRIVVFGQMLTTLRSASGFDGVARQVYGEVAVGCLRDAH